MRGGNIGLFGGQLNPLTIFGPGSVLQWVRADLKVTRVSGAVSLWGDNSVAPQNYDQATAGRRPVYTANDATLNNLPTITGDGVDDSLGNLTLTLPTPGVTPTSVFSIWKINTHVANSTIWSDDNNGGNIALFDIAGPLVRAQNGAGGGQAAFTPGQWYQSRADYSNQASDVLSVGATNTTGNAGNAAPTTGRSIFGSISGSSSNSSVFELVYVNRLPTASEVAKYKAYARAITGGVAQT